MITTKPLEEVDMLKAAQWYAGALGWHVFPVHSVRDGVCTCGDVTCKRPGKHPIGAMVGHGLHAATVDQGTIEKWWTAAPWANIGCATGAASGVVTLDVDIVGKPGEETLDGLLGLHGPLPDTPEMITGSGGRQVFFEWPGARVKNSVEKLGPGLDVRGDGGYTILPPSLHASGRRYEWESSSEPRKGAVFASMPGWLLAAVKAEQHVNAGIGGVAGGDGRPISEVEAARIRWALRYINPDGRDDWLTVGMALHSTGAGQQVYALWEEWAAKSEKYDAKDQWRVWQSFKPGGGVALGSMFEIAKRNGAVLSRMDGDVAPAEGGGDVVVPMDPSGNRSRLAAEIAETGDVDTLIGPIAERVERASMSHAAKHNLRKQLAKKAGVSVAALEADAKRRRSGGEDQGYGGWGNRIRFDDGMRPEPCVFNVALYLRHHAQWEGVLVLDIFSDTVTKSKSPPFPMGEAGEWTDRDDIHAALWLTEHCELRVNAGQVAEAVQVVADHSRVHPVREYLRGLAWDGRPRLATWTIDYLGAKDTPYHRLVARCWMIGAVARIEEPGCKMDNVLILEGRQNIGKSSVFEALGGAWAMETALALGDKDAFISQRGKWIIELAELDALNRTETSRAKQFFSARSDTYRPPYGRRAITVPRQCVYAGTVNHDQYLKDDTGNRRYWPVACTKADVGGLARDRDQLWAEAMDLYRGGEQWWLSGELDYVMAEQSARRQDDAWVDPIADYLLGKAQVSCSEILAGPLGMEVGRWGRVEQMRVASILKSLHWESALAGKKRARVYRPVVSGATGGGG